MTTAMMRRILSITQRTRREWATANADPDLERCGLHCTYALCKRLRQAGIPAFLVEGSIQGNWHLWLEIEDYVLDLFSKPEGGAPKITFESRDQIRARWQWSPLAASAIRLYAKEPFAFNYGA